MGKRFLRILDIGFRDYVSAWNLQEEYVLKRLCGSIPDVLILVEHPPVFTIGRAGTGEHIIAPQEVLEREGIKVYEINRGGDVTYHGPGQLVGYPILNLGEYDKDLHETVRKYEEVIIRLLAEYCIEAGRIEGLTGVWVGDEKIAAIGIGVRKWVTFHGFALNVNPNLEHFKLIVPCGIRDKGVTSMEKILKERVNWEGLKEKLIYHFVDVFEYDGLY
ncbi:Octanoyltransferase [Koleobacter methoxysyntrophicus]|uniref:Octanoyltransferase n=1 Tax=Koleobacter methoxysyntrophicus TaxID=2751313 RepID=A0A8A0RNJ2_9FIRM|nr:lipoyl(octanoyl) transferase LipB [Koleobacter methoxysyntrophicus]QSQ09007.1 Octanoyltransferase [Koleobacter methoxysyntrophicus]